MFIFKMDIFELIYMLMDYGYESQETSRNYVVL